jgi:hypothetical protein
LNILLSLAVVVAQQVTLESLMVAVVQAQVAQKVLRMLSLLDQRSLSLLVVVVLVGTTRLVHLAVLQE